MESPLGKPQLWLNPVERVRFMWTLPEFSNLGNLESLQVENSFAKWTVTMYPKGVEEEDNRYISLYLCLDSSSNETKLKAEFEFRLINADKKTERAMKFHRPKTFAMGQRRGFMRFYTRFELYNSSPELLPNDVLTIAGQIIIHLEPESNILNPAKPLVDSKMVQYFTYLFEIQKFTDITFLIGDRELKAHRPILAFQSKVFGAMFESDMLEKNTNLVLINDIEYDVFKAMLNFLYTNEAPNSDMVKELLMPADKYDLIRLKYKCQVDIYENMTIEDSAEVLFLADLHNCHILKDRVLDFIAINAYTVVTTEGWRSLETAQPRLFAEAYEEISTRIVV
ncbi:unnamed protein product [Ceutorhynchus assimilis]|uniref:BTB domain-containing protein n=1 Tax=Ceutorhynchus assimilis TaxID=467358 RepID=A0A9N9QJA3_9CUCU|nr:unnamed protein product [Ceutorhynchus assimilis]